MNTENILKTAHIHVESMTFRVHVDDTDKYDTNKMSEDEQRPSYIMWVSKSHDSSQKKQSLLVEVTGGDYDLLDIASWINSHQNF